MRLLNHNPRRWVLHYLPLCDRPHVNECLKTPGVIWKGDTLIPGVKDVLAKLRALGKKCFFVTNNSTKSRKGYKAKFDSLGLDVAAEEILSSSFAAAAYLEQTNFKVR